MSMTGLTLDAKIEEVAEKRRRYSADAYHFVFEALDRVSERPGRRLRSSKHITVSQLLDGIRELATDQYGPLARCVLESWGVYRTEDFGEIVGHLVAHDLLNQSEEDHPEDFRHGFDFREVFEQQYQPVLRGAH